MYDEENDFIPEENQINSVKVSQEVKFNASGSGDINNTASLGSSPMNRLRKGMSPKTPMSAISDKIKTLTYEQKK